MRCACATRERCGRRSRWWRIVTASIAGPLLVACGGGSDGSPATTTTEGVGAQPPTPTKCLVRLHGKGGTGQEPVQATDAGGNDILVVSPSGNADGWGARQWLYFPEEELDHATEIVNEAVDGCAEVIVHGFSNGGAFAATLYCRGENFDGRLVRVVIDDPVPDAGVEGCAPDPSVGVALYWTGALDAQARAGWDCAEADWTCAGGVTIGISAYASALGTDVLTSPFTDHQWYDEAPELSTW